MDVNEGPMEEASSTNIDLLRNMFSPWIKNEGNCSRMLCRNTNTDSFFMPCCPIWKCSSHTEAVDSTLQDNQIHGTIADERYGLSNQKAINQGIFWKH